MQFSVIDNSILPHEILPQENKGIEKKLSTLIIELHKIRYSAHQRRNGRTSENFGTKVRAYLEEQRKNATERNARQISGSKY